MSFKKINIEVIEAIDDVDSIIDQEDFSAYHDIKNALIKTLNFLLENKKADAEKHLLLCIRLFMDAPPKNKKLGLATLVKIDSIYKSLSAQIS